MKVDKYETLAIQAFDNDFNYLGTFKPTRDAMADKKYYPLADLKRMSRKMFKQGMYFKAYKQDAVKVSFFQWYDRKGKKIATPDLNKIRGLDLDEK